jgi:hypothetical protein
MSPRRGDDAGGVDVDDLLEDDDRADVDDLLEREGVDVDGLLSDLEDDRREVDRGDD